jgi:hypothetical protein
LTSRPALGEYLRFLFFATEFLPVLTKFTYRLTAFPIKSCECLPICSRWHSISTAGRLNGSVFGRLTDMTRKPEGAQPPEGMLSSRLGEDEFKWRFRD